MTVGKPKRFLLEELCQEIFHILIKQFQKAPCRISWPSLSPLHNGIAKEKTAMRVEDAIDHCAATGAGEPLVLYGTGFLDRLSGYTEENRYSF
jgi:hypothetical protein